MYIQNPLDEFNTYSVHYIMLACRTTTTAQAFASDDDKAMAASLAAVDKTSALGQPVVLNNNATDVFLVMDTRRFSQFTVESLKYDVLINGLQKGGSTSNLAVDLQMTILDSVGISFANFMQWLMDYQMKTNYDGLIFMLRTIFVGHKPDGTSETVQSETIPMHLNKMEINLDYAKGAYNLEFMPNMNFDVNRYARFLSVSLATTYKTGKGNTLRTIVQNLEDELNRKSEEYYEEVQTIVKKSGSTDTLGRPVKYMITLPSKRWGDFEVLGATPGAAAELKWVPAAVEEKTTAPGRNENYGNEGRGHLKETYTAVKPSLSIPKVLDAIFKQTPEVAKLGNFQTDTVSTDGFVTFYKYIVGLTSDDTCMMVHVDVVEFKVPNLFAQEQPKSKATSIVSQQEDEFYKTETDPVTGIIRREPRNFLEYDYIFTGRNKDILNFDMKIQDFQFLLASNIRIGDGAVRGTTDGSVPNADPTEKNNDLLYTRKYDPILMPLDSKAALENFSKYTLMSKTKDQANDITKQSQQYTKNLSMFYAGSPITVALTIKGNPLIMHKFNMGKLLQHPGSPSPGGSAQSGSAAGGAVGDSRVAYRKNLEEQILHANPDSFEKRGDSFVLKNNLDSKSYAISPVFVKVNIKGPNVDFRTNEPASDTNDYATSVLSDNFYVVFKLTNIIQGSAFTQELELYSHNIFGRTKINKDDHSNAYPNAATR